MIEPNPTFATSPLATPVPGDRSGDRDAGIAPTDRRAVARWLYAVCACIVLMVAVGGFVRLTRSGLAIVEWNVVAGVVPPLSESAWRSEFAKYQRTPEYRHVNRGMTLVEYQEIFLIEWFHRLLGRVAGLVVILPLAAFLVRGAIPWRRAGVYLAIAALFVSQGALGWYMVQSGLVDRPSVSHLRLTAHLLLALAVLGITFWQALALTPRFAVPERRWGRSRAAKLAIALLAALALQVVYGGFVAGLKAGHVSDTFPLMLGQLVPAGMLSAAEPWWHNLVSTGLTVHFVHRWLAFGVLAVALALRAAAGRGEHPADVRRGADLLVALVALQIALGILVVWTHVPLPAALIHQTGAMGVFLAAVFLNYRLQRG